MEEGDAHNAQPLRRGASHAEKVPLMESLFRNVLEIMTSVPLYLQAYLRDTTGSVPEHRNKVSHINFLVF